MKINSLLFSGLEILRPSKFQLFQLFQRRMLKKISVSWNNIN